MAHASVGVDPAIMISSSSESAVLKTFISRLHFSAVGLINGRLDKLAHSACLSLLAETSMWWWFR